MFRCLFLCLVLCDCVLLCLVVLYDAYMMPTWCLYDAYMMPIYIAQAGHAMAIWAYCIEAFYGNVPCAFSVLAWPLEPGQLSRATGKNSYTISTDTHNFILQRNIFNILALFRNRVIKDYYENECINWKEFGQQFLLRRFYK